ncbi:hypothetical protein JCM3765_002896 [Sporobolomyces pararoseus]
MPSTTSTAPSLLSRLSPLPIESRQPPPSDHTLINNSPRERLNGPGDSQLSSSVSSNQSHSLTKSHTSRSFSSPKKGKFGGPGSHLSSLPDEVLQRALPIPPSRSTTSSRWASSPPSRTHTVKKGFSPLLQATNPSSSPPPISSTSPSTSPALQQIETMLSQLRTAVSPSKTSTSSSPSNRNHLASSSPSKVSHSPTKSLLSSSRSPARPDSFLSRSPSNRPPEEIKRPALGGKSRWARDSDEEPEPVEVPKKEQPSRVIKEGGGAEPGVSEDQAEILQSKVETEEKAPVPQDATEPTTVPSSPAFEPSHVAPFHIDWAEDEEDALPDLDDWGVTTDPFLPQPETETEVVPEPPLSPTLSTTSTMSNRSKRNRRRNSATSSTHPPPLPADPSSRFSQTRPPKPVTNRLFNSARAAALPPPVSPASISTAPPHSAKQTPPHQRHRPTPDPTLKTHPSEALDSNWRAKGPGPSPALFSKLSGMRPANGAGGAAVANGKAPGEGGNSRRSRRGRSRTSSAAGATDGATTGAEKKILPPPPTSTKKSKEGGAGEGWTKVGGGGTHSSRWA